MELARDFDIEYNIEFFRLENLPEFSPKSNSAKVWRTLSSVMKLPESALVNSVIESMHWLLDVHFAEDFCRIEDDAGQQILNLVHKIVLNHVKAYKQNTGSKLPLSNIYVRMSVGLQEVGRGALNGKF